MRKRSHRLSADWLDAWIIDIQPRATRARLTNLVVPQVLRSYFASCDQDFRVLRDDHGRPVCPEIDLNFNLAHSGRLAIVTVGQRDKLGVDLERIETEGVDFDTLVAEHFCAHETRAYFAAAPSKRKDIFFHVWTQKEAVTKAIGLGMRQPLQEVAVEPNPELGTRLIALNGQSGDGWTLRSLFVGDEYYAAIAAFGSPFLINVRGSTAHAEEFAV